MCHTTLGVTQDPDVSELRILSFGTPNPFPDLCAPHPPLPGPWYPSVWSRLSAALLYDGLTGPSAPVSAQCPSQCPVSLSLCASPSWLWRFPASALWGCPVVCTSHFSCCNTPSARPVCSPPPAIASSPVRRRYGMALGTGVICTMARGLDSRLRCDT